MKKYFSIVVMLMISIATFAKGDIKTVVYTTQPVMHCASCENNIKGNIRFVGGVKSIETNVEKQTVTIKYDAAKTSTDAIEKGFKKIGYDVKKLSETSDAKAGKKSKAKK